MRWGVYSAVVVATVLVALFRYTLDRFLGGESHVLLPFAIPVMLGAWYAGLRCGLFATVLNLAVLAYFFTKPTYSFQVDDVADRCSNKSKMELLAIRPWTSTAGPDGSKRLFGFIRPTTRNDVGFTCEVRQITPSCPTATAGGLPPVPTRSSILSFDWRPPPSVCDPAR